jgi:tetratricopeptide (TPR) repeat protein
MAVLLADGSQIKVNANSRLVLKQVALPTRRVAMRLMQSLLRLFSGEIWVRSLAEPLEIETLAATATIRGTELNLAIESTDTAHLAVMEGIVEFHNPEGSVRVGAQEQARARVGEAPRKTVLLNPLDAVQWSLYYPGIVSYRDYSLAEVGPTLLQKRLTELERRAAALPQDVNAVIALGEVLFDLGKRMEARTQFEKALRLAPRDPRAHTGVGWVYLEAGESEAALRQFHQAEPSTLMSLVGKAHALYRLDRFEKALEVIAEAKRSFPRSPRPWTQMALIYLIQGRVPEALAELDRALRLDPEYALAHGLRSNIYLVRNQKERALEAAQQAVAANPFSPAAHLDLSLVKQAEFKLEEALQAARKAVALDPEDPQALIQISRLLFGQGEVDEAFELAERARRLAPQDPVVLSTWGFLQLVRGKVNEAIGVFDRAIGQDPTRGEPHLGKGLALFRRGKTEEGVEEMRIATLLESKVSLYHSYLGKAFYEVKEDKLAGQQLALAKELDPRDPTAYFYDAIRKHSVNRPVEALEDLQKSIELNDNRAVYRSRLLLDEDLAARGAALGRIYRELGFQQQALVEGWTSLGQDPTDYTAHRLLADAYSVLPRHEIARVSELLQSQLLQPLNITPVQPQLAESDLFLLGGLGPTEPSLNEFNSLFQRNRFSLLASGLVGTQETYSDEVVHSGLWNNLSYSLGQFHYETGGLRSNNDIDVDIYNAFVQGHITSKLNVQAEFRHRQVEHGDLDSLFAPTPFHIERMRTFREETEADTYRFGIHVAPSKRSDLLGSFTYLDQDTAVGQDPDAPLDRATEDGYIAEAQYLYRHAVFAAVLGGGYYRVDLEFGSGDSTTEHGNVYLYSHLRYPAPVSWTLGVSVDTFDEDRSDGFGKTLHATNPKFGVLWNITPDTVFRAAVFKTLKRSLLANQTLEPVQVAGFNQFFDDFNGTESVRWGAGLDHRFSPKFTGGVEVSKRDLDVPIAVTRTDDWEESLYRAYLHWAPHPRWVTTIEYFKEDFDNLAPSGPLDTETQVIPISTAYFNPSGLFAKLRASYLDQEVALDTGPDRDGTTFLDVGLGYRLPQRHGIFEVLFQNMLDQGYRYEGLQNRRPPQRAGVPSFLPFPSELTIFARMTLAF